MTKDRNRRRGCAQPTAKRNQPRHNIPSREKPLDKVFIVAEASMYEGKYELNLSWAYTNEVAAEAHLKRLVQGELDCDEGGIFSDGHGDPIPGLDFTAKVVNEYSIEDRRPHYWCAKKDDENFLEISIYHCHTKEQDISQEAPAE
jgi:hypothetical protein